MIGKVFKGQGFARLTSYILGKEESELVCTNLAGKTPEEFYYQLELTKQLNPYVQFPAYHIIVSFPPQEKPVQHLEEIVESTLLGLGLHKNLYFAATHNDTEHLHLHIAASRIDIDGKCVSDWMDIPRLENLLRNIEKQHQLTPVPCSWEIECKHEISAQYWRKRREQIKFEEGLKDSPPEPSAREKIQKGIMEAIASAPDFPDYIKSLESKGINVGVRISPKGKVEGLTYKIDEVRFAAKSLKIASAHPPTLTGLQKLGVNFQLERDAGILARLILQSEAAPHVSIEALEKLLKTHPENQKLQNQSVPNSLEKSFSVRQKSPEIPTNLSSKQSLQKTNRKKVIELELE